jgi:glycerol uptake facilitator-like aquaporin
VLLIFSARISGSHFNPAVTVAFMFRKDTGRFSRVLGITYIIAQILGAMCGAFLAYTFFQAQTDLTVKINANGNYMWSQAMVEETMGSALLVFLYLSQTEEKTKLSDDPAITTLIISASYYAAIYLGYNTTTSAVSSLNPAISLGLITFQVFAGNFSAMHFSWIYCVFGFLGAALAVILFEFVYKRSQEIVNEEVGDDIDDHTALIDA